MTNEGRATLAGNLVDLLEFLNDTPKQLGKLTDGLSLNEFRWKPSEAEFSVLENLCHLRDLEVLGYARRIELILSESDPALADFDGARIAAEGHYNDELPAPALAKFAETRSGNVAKLRIATETELNRCGMLAGVGAITLRRLAELMREHDEGHLEDLRVLRQRLELHRPDFVTRS